MIISSIDKDVSAILSSGFYKIPRFQRPYSWSRENIDDFWNDIIVESVDDYFIGSMVVYEIKKGIFGVVDGQQRLTTITIILGAIRDAFNKIEEEKLSIPKFKPARLRHSGGWQKSFRDHMIRNTNDLDEHFKYTAYNFKKHKLPDDWKYTSLNFPELIDSPF